MKRRRTRSTRIPATVPGQPLEARILLSAVSSANDSFETGLPDHWSIPQIAGEGRVSVRNLIDEGLVEVGLSEQFTTAGNAHALVFDSARTSGDSVKDLALAVMEVDLSSASSALLTFHQLEGVRGDINDELPTKHSLTALGDGLAISDDGVDWYSLLNLRNFSINRASDGLWQLFEFDLIDNIQRLNTEENAGIDISQPLEIKFSQYDDDVFPRRGWAIDNVRLQAAAPEFSLDEPRGVFHRFNLAGEDDADYFYRAAVFGDPDANTPILVSTHGSNGDNDYVRYSRTWHRFVADPANGIDSLIVVAPAFVESTGAGRFNSEERYPLLSWNRNTDAAADLVLLQTIDTIAATGVGDADGLYMWGFSAGGQFTGRFVAAHPDRVSAAVVGGPASQILPDDTIAFPYGIGDSTSRPRPAGVSFSKDEFLKSRVMYWVGQDDDDPNHDQLSRGPSVDSVQGISRLRRSVNQYREMHEAAQQLNIAEDQFEYELLISEGDGHGWGSNDTAEIYEFLSRGEVTDAPVRVHPVVVSAPSPSDEQIWLPQHVERIAGGETFFVEFWIESPTNSAVDSGAIDVFFDSTKATASSIQHGQYSNSTSGTIDNSAGRIRNLSGSTTSTTAGVGNYALLGTVEFTASATLTDTDDFFIASQRIANSKFELATGESRFPELLPFSKTQVAASANGLGTLVGSVFSDLNADGVRQADEPGLAGRTVNVSLNPQGPIAFNQFALEPDNSLGHGAYVTNFSPAAKLSAVGTEVEHAGLRASERGSAESSTGAIVFANNDINGNFQSQFVEGKRELRIDFDLPTSSVSIDVIAKLGDAEDRGKLSVYGSNGQLLDSLITPTIADGEVATLAISRQTPDIAYAVATGEGTQNVRLDNLLFTSQLTTTTDNNGNYKLDGFAAGDFHISTTALASEILTSAPADIVAVSGQTTTSTNFGIHQNSLIAAPGLVDRRLREGESQTFGLTLLGRPASPVTYNFESTNSEEVSIVPSSVVFTSANWNTPQQITISGKDDFLADEATFSDVTVSREDLQVATFRVDVDNDDIAGVVVSESDDSTVVGENGLLDSIEVSLSAMPESNVIVFVSPTASGQVTTSVLELVFTSDNWNTPQEVEVRAVNDQAVDGDIDVPIRISVDPFRSDDAFDNAPQKFVTVTTVDDDVAGFEVTESESTTDVSETGDTDTFEIVLTSQPNTDVILVITSADETEVNVTPPSLIFTSENWNTAQTVTATGVDDSELDGDQVTEIVISVDTEASNDFFDSLAEQSLAVTTTDDEEQIRGNVDGDTDFDANDSFLIHLVKLAGTNTQIDQSKGSSPLDATDIRNRINQLNIDGDVDGDGDFDANDSFLVHLVRLAGTNGQIDQSKGSSSLTAVEIRSKINALGQQGNGESSPINTPPKLQQQDSLFENVAHDQPVEIENSDDDQALAFETLWQSTRNWIDLL